MIRLEDRSPLNNSDGLITIEGVPGYFSKFSGVSFKVNRGKHTDGLTSVSRPLPGGKTEYEDFTLSRTFDPAKDGPLLEWAEIAKGTIQGKDVTARPVVRNNGVEPIGTMAWRLYGCYLTSFKSFEIDTDDGTKPVMIEISFAYEQAEWV
jgi:T4-like virus tail tube protein gp19